MLNNDSVLIEKLNSKLEWEQIQNQMIIKEVGNFKKISKELREKSIDFLIESKEDEERRDLLDSLTNKKGQE